MAMTVSKVAKLTGVSVRTLHHYDAIGLVRPSGRSEGGYRLYDRADLERLEQVLFFRELDFGLEEIRRVLDAPDFDRREALLMQRRLLAERAARNEALMRAVDRALGALETGYAMTDEEMLEVFGDFNPKDHEEEVKQRWGDTDAYKESARRTKRYRKEDWQRIRDESEAITLGLVRLLEAGAPADGVEAMDLAEQARLHIDRWFYPCSRQMHRNFGEMYVQDDRFTATYDKVRPGLAKYVRDAIVANTERG